jgi:hypothetical protein
LDLIREVGTRAHPVVATRQPQVLLHLCVLDLSLLLLLLLLMILCVFDSLLLLLLLLLLSTLSSTCACSCTLGLCVGHLLVQRRL